MRSRCGRALLATVRAFFAERGVLEVETPALSQGATTDPQIDSLHAAVRGAGRRYLHTSPEFAMKRLLAAGVGDLYQLCRVFRDGERGRAQQRRVHVARMVSRGRGPSRTDGRGRRIPARAPRRRA